MYTLFLDNPRIYLECSVFGGTFVNSDENRDEVWEQIAVLIPISEKKVLRSNVQM